ncbi:MAG: AAA family ATPase [Actinobacteria bacterium]|nr:AAA family ATPase [Actinomycetota bacterium]
MSSIWDAVVGQTHVVDQLQRAAEHPVHAYLFVGPEGCGKEEAARAFAAQLLAGTDDSQDRICDMVMRGRYIDAIEVHRVGASISKDQAEEVIAAASTTGHESRRKVIIMHELHLMQDSAVVRLLKTIEEPADGVTLILLTDQMVPLLVTIASRCVQLHFAMLDEETIVNALVSEGFENDAARGAAHAAQGSMSRARLLVNDRDLQDRLHAFASVPRRINGTGSVAEEIVTELLSMIDDSAAPLIERHENEASEMEERMGQMGVRKSGKKALEDQHKRELRRHRTDELRSGLVQIAATYRDELVNNAALNRPTAYTDAIARIHDAMSRLALNVNETVLMRDLIWSLPALSSDALHGGNHNG